MLEQLKIDVCEANLELKRNNLIIYSWGNVSGIDRDKGIVAIKPSGISYDVLTPDDIVLLDMDGNVVEGVLHPSSDTPTHLELYRNFPTIGGVCHTHSLHATVWAQACRPIPCLGTTHADYFYGTIPVTAVMSEGRYSRTMNLTPARSLWRPFCPCLPTKCRLFWSRTTGRSPGGPRRPSRWNRRWCSSRPRKWH